MLSASFPIRLPKKKEQCHDTNQYQLQHLSEKGLGTAEGCSGALDPPLPFSAGAGGI